MKRIINTIARLVWAIKNFKCLDELLALKDLQSQGLLVKLPVAIGTPVFFIDIDEETLERCITEEKFDYWMIDGWGKWAFATEHEAEDALGNEKFMNGEMSNKELLANTCEIECPSKRISHNALCDKKHENCALKTTLILTVITLFIACLLAFGEIAVILYD